jgi:glycosyltransferase involved in cell wall biosynthesis
VLDVPTTGEVDMGERLRVRYCPRIMPHSVSPTFLRELPNYVRWADVVNLSAVYSFPTIATLVACRMLSRPVVWSPHGALQRWGKSTRPRLKKVWEQVCRIAAPHNALLHLTSEEEAQESMHRLRGIEAIVIPNGVEIPEEMERAERSDTLRMVFLGRLHPKKGIENLLAACRLLNRRGLKYSLTIAGAGEHSYEASLKRVIKRLGLSNQATMIGQVMGEAKRALFQNADVVVVPSYTENFCMVVAEALAHKVPVIASEGTPWARVEEVGCGLWVDNQPEILADAIEQINRMPLTEMGKKGRRWMIDEFAWDKITVQMLACYNNLVAARDSQ